MGAFLHDERAARFFTSVRSRNGISTMQRCNAIEVAGYAPRTFRFKSIINPEDANIRQSVSFSLFFPPSLLILIDLRWLIRSQDL